MRYLVALAAVVTAAPASAAVFTITYTGTVREGTTSTDRFGSAPTDISGQSVTAVYTLDDATPGAIITDYQDADTRAGGVDGGADYGTLSPVTATVAIGGLTLPTAGYARGYFNVYHIISNLYGDSIGASASGFVPDAERERSGYVDFTAYSVTPGTTTGDYRDPFSYVFQPGDTATGRVSYTTYASDFRFDDPTYFRLDAEITPLTVSVVRAAGAVPEPASWATMIGGFALVGGAVRRRVRVAYA